jgi:fermentation-respiration switch protein FrsA (DUF1100 family)
MKRFVAICAALLFVTILGALSLGWMLARPVQTRIGDPPLGLDAEPVSFESDSGAEVHGWWCPVGNGRGAVLLLPGIRANRLSMVDRARFLRRAGYSVLLIDFQATGETKGDRITFGWKESRDAIAAVNFIRNVEPDSRVAIIGSSLGGVATLLATPPLKIEALILESVYPTIEIATRHRLENYFGRLGELVTPLFLKQLRARLGISADDLRPIDHIGNVHCPVFIMSGASDRHTRPADTEMLFFRAESPKQLWLVPKAGHVDLHRAAGSEYESRVLAFLEQM